MQKDIYALDMGATAFEFTLNDSGIDWIRNSYGRKPEIIDGKIKATLSEFIQIFKRKMDSHIKPPITDKIIFTDTETGERLEFDYHDSIFIRPTQYGIEKMYGSRELPANIREEDENGGYGIPADILREQFTQQDDETWLPKYHCRVLETDEAGYVAMPLNKLIWFYADKQVGNKELFDQNIKIRSDVLSLADEEVIDNGLARSRTTK